jgi:flagellar motor switch protein FliN
MKSTETTLPSAVPFPYESLARLRRGSVRRSRVLLRGLGILGRSRQVSLPELSRIALCVRRLDVEPALPSAGDGGNEVALGLLQAGMAARLTVDSALALFCVYATLGAPPPATLRPLSPAEHGVLTALVARVLAALGIVVQVVPRPPLASEDAVASIEIAVEGKGFAGSAFLHVSNDWLMAPASGALVSAPAELETAIHLELARTTLDAPSWSEAQPGDAVVFEGIGALAHEGPWACRIRIGELRAEGELRRGGELRATGSFVQGHGNSPTNRKDQKGKDRMPGERDDLEKATAGEMPSNPANVLAAAPVELVAEIGRVHLRVDELMGLVEGAVLELGPRTRDAITLRVGDRLWARGELVTIDDELGVRLIEIFRRS